jgi:hypothetical protein
MTANVLSQAESKAPDEPLPEPGFLLAVGTLAPRKHLPRLVAAYGRASSSGRFPSARCGTRLGAKRELTQREPTRSRGSAPTTSA